MRIHASFTKKIPVPGIEYGSQGFACEIEIEPPAEVREDRSKLQRYVEALFQECRQRVEDQIQAVGQPSPSGNGSSPSPATDRENGSGNGNGRSSQGHHRPFRSGRPDRGLDRQDLARSGPNGQAQASPKQMNFLRSLSRERGMAYEDLQDAAYEAFGKDIRELSRREASTLIDQLQEGGRRAS